MTNTVDNRSFLDASRIFTGHRALGLVSNHIPLVTRYIPQRKETLIVTVIGNSYHTYGVSFRSFDQYVACNCDFLFIIPSQTN